MREDREKLYDVPMEFVKSQMVCMDVVVLDFPTMLTLLY